MRHLGTALAVTLVTFTAGTASAQTGGGKQWGHVEPSTDPRAKAPVPAGADTVMKPILLSAERVKSYLAVQQTLHRYWTVDEAHMALYAKAPGARRYFPDALTGQKVGSTEGGLSSINTIDYPAVAKQDPTVAGIFTANHITPEQWLDTHVAVAQARRWVEALKNEPNRPAPEGTSVLGKNLTVVQPFLEDIRRDAPITTSSKIRISGSLGGGVAR